MRIHHCCLLAVAAGLVVRRLRHRRASPALRAAAGADRFPASPHDRLHSHRSRSRQQYGNRTRAWAASSRRAAAGASFRAPFRFTQQLDRLDPELLSADRLRFAHRSRSSRRQLDRTGLRTAPAADWRAWPAGHRFSAIVSTGQLYRVEDYWLGALPGGTPSTLLLTPRGDERLGHARHGTHPDRFNGAIRQKALPARPHRVATSAGRSRAGAERMLPPHGLRGSALFVTRVTTLNVEQATMR